MPEQHPIDNLFREALLSAGSTPPPELGARVLASVRRKRRRAVWYRVTGIAALLLVGVLGTWYFVDMKADQETVHASQEGPVPAPSMAGVVQEEHTPLHQPARQGEQEIAHTTRTTTTRENPGAVRVPSPRSTGMERSEPAQAKQISEGNSVSAVEVSTSTTENHPIVVEMVLADDMRGAFNANGTAEPIAKAEVRAERDQLDRLRYRDALADVSATAFATLVTRNVPRYVLARGEWWCGLYASANNTQYAWTGGSKRLTNALEGDGKGRSSVSGGVAFGRRWRSGLVLSVGAEADHTRQAYRAVEHTTSTNQQLVTQFVTLNTTVYASDTDTIRTTVDTATELEGADTRTVVRVPIELAWPVLGRRLSAGPRIGLAMEMTRVRSSSSFVEDTERGVIRTATLEQDQLRSRYPTTLMGMVGLDLRYALLERLDLVVTPYYSSVLSTFADRQMLHATPQRTGLGLQLCHTF